MQRSMRMKKEMQMLSQSPPHGISCWAEDENLTRLEAQILGGDETPYTGGVFKLEIQIPERYPFEPPKVRFVTPMYHPNIDTAGRICLDTLKMPPKGAWKPCLNMSTVLTSIQLLMAEPNPEDPLMTDISNEFKHNRALFLQNAREWTEKHAKSRDPQHFKKSSEQKLKVAASEKTNTAPQSGQKRTQPMDDLSNKQLKTS